MLLLFSNLLFTETSNPNKTWYGDPDLQGIWTNATLTTLERPKHLKALEVMKRKQEVLQIKPLQTVLHTTINI